MTTTTTTAPDAIRLTGKLDPKLSRWPWLVKMFLAPPHFVILAALLVSLSRWIYRVIVYVALMRDGYPPFRLDTDVDAVAERLVARRLR